MRHKISAHCELPPVDTIHLGRCLGLGREDLNLYCRAAPQPHISRQSWSSRACVQHPPGLEVYGMYALHSWTKEPAFTQYQPCARYSAQDFTLEPLIIL